MEKLVTSQPKPHLTPEEYLAIERKAGAKSEYLRGEMFAMSGVSRHHVRIVTNLIAELDTQLRDRPCDVFSTDLRTKVSPVGLYTYPDVIVVCGEARFEDQHVDTLLNPTLVIEVLSDSTEAYDRGEKFGYYRTLESLTECVLVSQRECRIEQFVRGESGQWIFSECNDPAGALQLRSIDCRLQSSRVYHRVDFPQPSSVDRHE